MVLLVTTMVVGRRVKLIIMKCCGLEDGDNGDHYCRVFVISRHFHREALLRIRNHMVTHGLFCT